MPLPHSCKLGLFLLHTEGGQEAMYIIFWLSKLYKQQNAVLYPFENQLSAALNVSTHYILQCDNIILRKNNMMYLRITKALALLRLMSPKPIVKILIMNYPG